MDLQCFGQLLDAGRRATPACDACVAAMTKKRKAVS